MVYLNELEPAGGLETSNTTWNIKVYSGRDVYVYKTPISTYEVFYRVTDGEREIYPTQKDLENGEWAWKCKTIDGAVKRLKKRGFNVNKDDFTSGELYSYNCARLRDERDNVHIDLINERDESWEDYFRSKIKVYDKAIEQLEKWNKNKGVYMPTPEGPVKYDMNEIKGKKLFDI